MPIIDLESSVSIKELLEYSKNGKIDIDPAHYFQRYALNISLTLNHGFRIDGDIEDDLLKEITTVEREVANLLRKLCVRQSSRSVMLTYCQAQATTGKIRVHSFEFSWDLTRLRKSNEDGTDRPCIAGNILKDPEANLSHGKSHSHLVQ